MSRDSRTRIPHDDCATIVQTRSARRPVRSSVFPPNLYIWQAVWTVQSNTIPRHRVCLDSGSLREESKISEAHRSDIRSAWPRPIRYLAGILGAYADFLHTPQVPPSFAQCLQYLQFLHALQGSLPVQVEREAPEAMEMSKAQRRAFGQRVVMVTSGIRLEC
jgi:hypothetical protein